MLAIEFSFNLFVLSGLLCVAFVAGFLVRMGYSRSLKLKITELEKEMLSNHADILELQRERAMLVKQMKESQIPVIPMNNLKDENEKQAAVPAEKRKRY
jgi:outer membrane lipopolysaccharide assembly protein LptE/RlpB